ncbi:Hypothetical protein CINCED_3A004578 [Cinara cedri]|uniref:RING-type E3 ubiquitin transferase n=1 Tax=Cinara cedri TaxID=506608 RepID=A0A5E4MW77_9HEMI|nr:Hypothetical protein CINCED_3A004578 [Cinara cedri]
MASADPIGLSKTWELSLYELHRTPQEAITDNTEIAVSPRSLHSELMCPICLDMLKKTMTTKECLHSRDEYEAHQTRVLEKLNKSHSQANLVQSINEGIKIQTQNRLQRTKKNQQDEQNESSSSSTPKTPNNIGPVKDNVTRTVVQAKVAKKLKTVMISENDGPASSSADKSDITECDGASRGVTLDEIELVFKPHPTEMGSDNQLIKVLKENAVRYIKTTANATVEHLSTYLLMRLSLDLGPEHPERAVKFLIYVAPISGQYVPLNGNQTLRQVHDKYWKVNKPLEMFYSFN